MASQNRQPYGPPGSMGGGSKRAQQILSMAKGKSSATPKRPGGFADVTFSRQKKPFRPANDAGGGGDADPWASAALGEEEADGFGQALLDSSELALATPASGLRAAAARPPPTVYGQPRPTVTNYFARNDRPSAPRRQLPQWAPFRGAVRRPEFALPPGMANLGNTCYMNAVLQAVLSLPGFVADLQRGPLLRAGLAPAGSAYRALLDCALTKLDATRARGAINPSPLKSALEARAAAFRGCLQQDAHEFLCALLAAVQGEVLGAEAAALGRPAIEVGETADPVARNLGFSVAHELECRRCGHLSHLTEQFTHLSLELPQGPTGTDAMLAQADLGRMLGSYFGEEEVEKGCEGCGAACAPHRAAHSLRRLPRALALHVKRFKVCQEPGGGVCCQKVHTPVGIPPVLRLGAQCTPATLPALPGERGNAGAAAGAAAAVEAPGGSREEPPSPAALPSGGGVAPVLKASFYGGASGGYGGFGGQGSPVGGPFSGQGRLPQSPDFLRRRSPGDLGLGHRERAEREEEEQLQAVLRASALEWEAAQAEPGAAPHVDGPAAAPAAAAAAAGGAAPSPGAADRQEEEELQRALALSLQPAASPGGGSGGGAGEEILDITADSPAGAPKADTSAPAFNLQACIVEDGEAGGEGSGMGGGASPPAAVAGAGVAGAVFRLAAVVNHHGAQASCGHFTADVRGAGGAWHRHNDSLVSRIAAGDATGPKSQRDCYLLFFLLEP